MWPFSNVPFIKFFSGFTDNGFTLPSLVVASGSNEEKLNTLLVKNVKKVQPRAIVKILDK